MTLIPQRKPTRWALHTAAQDAARQHKRLLTKIGIIAVVGILISVSTGTWVNDLSQRRPGLWQIVTESGGLRRSSRELRICIDRLTDTILSRLSFGETDALCEGSRNQRRGDTVMTEMVCLVGDTRITVQADIAFSGDTAYHGVIKARFEPPTRTGLSDTTATQDAKWQGPCPADMNPGDVILPNGARASLTGFIKPGR